VRYRLAVTTTLAVNTLSRRLGRGQGTVAGGRAGLRVDRQLLQRLTAGRQVALVTGTNGKTTTTRLLAVALGADGTAVVSNETGSNMPPGHVAALAADRAAPRAVLEVDEIYLPRVLAATKASTVVLLNLSRDQLDRSNEVRMVAGNWRAALAASPRTIVVANADDPLVVWGAGAAAHVRWVAAGLGWQLDAVGCPSCEGRITFSDGDGDGDRDRDGGGDGDVAGADAMRPVSGSWACATGCGFARPEPMATLTATRAATRAATGAATMYSGIWADGRSIEIALALPGRFNHANALMAAVAAETQGIEPAESFAAMATLGDVAGRFTTRVVGSVRVRLMLAKNPAGWSELLNLVEGDEGPLVVSINARTADGADPSWLWDVPFERLASRTVVATGDRCRDLAVRLHYAGVAHVMESDPLTALHKAGAGPVENGGGQADGGDRGPAGARVADPENEVRVDVIGNYTAFAQLLGESAET
jgi:UDP-N-acetylmuramyl tripeptide synthase